jgi:hypothetical protein
MNAEEAINRIKTTLNFGFGNKEIVEIVEEIVLNCKVTEAIPPYITCSSPSYMKLMDEPLQEILSASNEELAKMLLAASAYDGGTGPSTWLMEHVAHILCATPFLDDTGKPII